MVAAIKSVLTSTPQRSGAPRSFRRAKRSPSPQPRSRTELPGGIRSKIRSSSSDSCVASAESARRAWPRPMGRRPRCRRAEESCRGRRRVSISQYETGSPSVVISATSSRDWLGGKSQSLENETTSQSHSAARNDLEPLLARVAHVEVVHREGHGHVGVGIEAPHELLALIREVRADRETLLEISHHVARRVAIEIELPRHRFGREIGDVAEHAGEREARLAETRRCRSTDHCGSAGRFGWHCARLRRTRSPGR